MNLGRNVRIQKHNSITGLVGREGIIVGLYSDNKIGIDVGIQIDGNKLIFHTDKEDVDII